MNFRNHLRLKRKVIFALIVFCTYSIIGVLCIYSRSSGMDKEHIQIIETLDDIEIDFYHSRIMIGNNIIEHNKYTNKEINTIRLKIQQNINFLIKNTENENKLLLSLKDEVNTLLKDKHQLNEINKSQYKFSQLFTLVSNNIHKSVKYDNTKFTLGILIFSIILIICLSMAILFIINIINKLIKSDRLTINNTIKVEEEERNRIAMDLHDDLGAQLSSISIYTKLLEREYTLEDGISEKIHHIKTLAKQALDSPQRVISILKPEHISKYGLITALEKFAYTHNKVHSQYIQINSSKLNISLENTSKIILYRISTELINNSIKHSEAKQIKINIYNKKNIIHYTYQDNGKGFNINTLTKTQGMGLTNIKKRVDMLGGLCEFESHKNEGMFFKLEFNRFNK